MCGGSSAGEDIKLTWEPPPQTCPAHQPAVVHPGSTDIWAGYFLVVGGRPMHYWTFCSLPDLHPLNDSSLPPVLTTKHVGSQPSRFAWDRGGLWDAGLWMLKLELVKFWVNQDDPVTPPRRQNCPGWEPLP